MTAITLNTGDFAYLHSVTQHHGLIPLKVTAIEVDTRQDGKLVKHVVAKVTTNHHPYKRGDQVTSESLGKIVPRAAVAIKWDSIVVSPFEIGE